MIPPSLDAGSSSDCSSCTWTLLPEDDSGKTGGSPMAPVVCGKESVFDSLVGSSQDMVLKYSGDCRVTWKAARATKE